MTHSSLATLRLSTTPTSFLETRVLPIRKPSTATNSFTLSIQHHLPSTVAVTVERK